MSNQEQRTPMTFEQRMDALASALEAEAREREKSRVAFDASMEALKRRHDALTMNMELAWRDVEAGRAERDKDADAIRRLANIAMAHEHRLSDLEGPQKA